MIEPSLLRDKNGVPIQSLAPFFVENLTISTSQATIILDPNSRILRLTATSECWLTFGDSSVIATANAILFPTGVEIFTTPEDATHLAVIQASSVGILNVCSMG